MSSLLTAMVLAQVLSYGSAETVTSIATPITPDAQRLAASAQLSTPKAMGTLSTPEGGASSPIVNGFTPTPPPPPPPPPQINTSLAPIIAPIVSAIVVIIVSIITANVTLRASDKSLQGVSQTLWQKANDEECKRLEKSLDEFYFPFLQLSEVSFLLSQHLRDRLKDENYRMLLALMQPGWKERLPSGDQAIVKEVCENGKRLEDLIYRHAGVVDEPLLQYLGRASTHYRMLNLAFEGKLGTDTAVFKPYVFPDYLHDVLRMQVSLLRARCAYLRANPEKAPPPIDHISIPEAWALEKWPDPPRKRVGSSFDGGLSPPTTGEENIAAENGVI